MFVHLISRVGVGPAVEQQAHHLEVAVYGGNVEARGAVLPASKKEGIKRVGVHRFWACSARWLRAWVRGWVDCMCEKGLLDRTIRGP